ncbi:MAG TPA: hypothetical protein VJ720_07805 [Chitinophaga sp.]|nr:hypothetical protein [Chitinophaga sp.]
MKRYLLLLMAAFALAYTACSKESGIDGNTDPEDSTSTPPNTKKDSIVSYSEVQFALLPGSETYGRVFSTIKGKVYTDNVPDSIGKYLDLAFINFGSSSMFFASVNDPSFDLKLPGVTTTLVRNTVPDSILAVSAFDTLTHAATLNKQTIATDDGSFASTDLPVLILFQNGYGKKGVIKVKSMGLETITADIKVVY